MKPFFFLLILIASGIVFDTLSHPLTLIAEATLSLGRKLNRTMAKLARVSAAIPASGRPDTNWRPAAQF